MPHRRAMQEVHQGSSSFWGRLAQNEQVQRKNHIDRTQIYGLLCGLNVAIPCSFSSISALATQQSAWRVCPHKSAYMMAGLWDLSQTIPSTFCTHDPDSQTWLTYQASCSELGKSTAARCKGLFFCPKREEYTINKAASQSRVQAWNTHHRKFFCKICMDAMQTLAAIF